jgi:hypothetical protein
LESPPSSAAVSAKASSPPDAAAAAACDPDGEWAMSPSLPRAMDVCETSGGAVDRGNGWRPTQVMRFGVSDGLFVQSSSFRPVTKKSACRSPLLPAHRPAGHLVALTAAAPLSSFYGQSTHNHRR